MKIFTLNRLAFSGALFIFVLVISSCTKNNFEFNKLEKTTYSPTLAAPLINSNLSLENLLLKNNSGGLITQNDSGFCTLVYNKTLLSICADSLIQLPSQQFAPYSISLNTGQINVLGTSNTVTVNYNQVITFNTGSNNPTIDTVIFKAGSLDATINSTFPCSGNVIVSIPSASKNGDIFTVNMPFNYTGNTPITVSIGDSLAGYLFDMTKTEPATNAFVINYQLTLNSSGVAPTTSDMISVNGSLSNLKFSKIYGYLGQLSLFPSINSDTIPITIFKNYTGNGTFNIVNPTLKVTLSNSYGVPVNAGFPLLERFTPPASIAPVTGVPNPLPVLTPSYSQQGQILTDSFKLTKANSNIYSIISNYPKYFIFSAAAVTNKNGYAPNFVLDSSRFKIGAEVDLPLYGSANNFTLVDTVQFSPGQFITSNVQSALLKIYTNNGLPIDVNMQVYFTDSTYHILDSLVIPNQLILKSGVVNSAGMVVAPTANTYMGAFTEGRLANLAKTKYALLKSVESTTNGGTTNVKIYSSYNLNVQVGMEVQLKTKL